eukprot:163708-Chlamydomonas_euryale.AAC.1
MPLGKPAGVPRCALVGTPRVLLCGLSSASIGGKACGDDEGRGRGSAAAGGHRSRGLAAPLGEAVGNGASLPKLLLSPLQLSLAAAASPPLANLPLSSSVQPLDAAAAAASAAKRRARRSARVGRAAVGAASPAGGRAAAGAASPDARRGALRAAVPAASKSAARGSGS